jgi:membrane-bound serine protease (ClpP class)
VVLADSGPDQTAWIAAAAGAGLVLAGFAVFAGGRAARARAAPPRSAVQDLVGATARVRTPLDPEGQVFVDGALWHARLDPEHQPQLGVPAGRTVRVDGVRGLTLIVHPEPEEAP